MNRSDELALERALEAPAPTPTGIPTEYMYRLSRSSLDAVHGQALGTAGLRLLHGTMFVAGRSVRNWFGSTEAQPPEGGKARCTELRDLFGHAGSKDNRGLAKGIAELERSGLFDRIGFGNRNKWLLWRFTDDFRDLLFADGRFGLFDVRMLKTISSPLEFCLYSEIAMVRRMRWPQLHFSIPHLMDYCGYTSARWCDRRVQLLTALQKIARIHDLFFVVLLEEEGVTDGIDAARIRIRSPHTVWRTEGLQRTRARTRKVLVIDGEEHADVPPASLPDAIQRLRRGGWKTAALRLPADEPGDAGAGF